MALLAPWAANAQVQIGSGTTTNSYLPSYSYYNYSLSQQIYTAEEISASGEITSVAFFNGGTAKDRQFDIYMAHTEKSAFESTSDWIELTERDMVYNGQAAVTIAANEWTTFTFDTPFAYNGTDNLVLCVIDRSGSWSSGMSCRVFSADNQAMFVYNDSYSALNPDGTNGENAVTGTIAAVKNQIILGGIQQAYPTPTDLTVSGITATSATLNWTENGTATSWEVAYKAASDEDFTTVTTSTKPYTIEGLTPQTAYNAKVRAYYSTTTQSGWAETSFTTNELCPDGMVCIGSGTATNIYLPTYTYYNYSLTQQIYTAEEIGASGYILSVDFHCSAEQTRTLDIYMVSTEKSIFESTTDWIPVTAADMVFSGSVTFAAGDWTTIEFDNPFVYDGTSNVALIVDDNTGSYVSSPSFYVFDATSQAIRVYSDGTNYDPENPSSYNGTIMNVKNRIRLEIGVPPTCPKPKSLAASNVTNHTATLNWTAGGEETQWTVQYGQREDFTDATSVDVTATTKELTGLAAETVYYARVKANCGEGDESVWTDAVSFETEIACPAPTNLTVSDVEPFAATVSWNGSAENYNLRYRVPSGFNYGFETAEAFVVDEFPPCTTYDGDGLSTYGISDYSMPNANYVGSVIAFSDNDQWAAHSGNTMGAFMDAIPSDDVTANDDYFITPALTIAREDHFIFWARSVTANYGLERMKVGIYGGNGTISTYFAGDADTYVEVPVEWTKYDFDLSDYADQTIQLAINCVSADAFALLFDDLFVGNPNDDTWDVTLNNVTSPYNLTGLSDETTYELQVQAACGGADGVSEWVGTTFMTPSNCSTPTNLAANNITPNAATLSWEGFHDTYNVQYRTAEHRMTYYFNDFNTDQTGWTYNNAIYGLTDPIYNVDGSSNYFLSMGWNSTSEETIISCELPAYERGARVEFYYFGYTTANTFQVGFSTTTNDADAFTWSDPIDAPLRTYTLYNEELAEGVKYVAWKATASAQAACVFIDDFGIFGETIPAGAWQTENGVTTPYELRSLAGNTKYEWQVQGINAGCDGGVTPWSQMATFTTPDACQVPVINEVTNIEATTATVNWTGVQDSYNVRYGAFELFSLVNFDDQVIPADWTNDETYPWALTDALTNAGYCLRSTNQGISSSSASISFTATYESAGVISFDAMFMGEGTSTAWDKCIFSIDGTQKFEYGAIGQEWYNMAYSFTAGEHTFTWTYSKDSSVNPDGDFFAINNVKVVLHNETWTTVENVTGDSFDITGLTPESVIAVQVQGNSDECDGGVTEWSSEYLFITGKQTTVTQTLELIEGWNWVSLYVEGEDAIATLQLLENALGENAYQISSADFMTEYDEEWFGDLDEIGITNDQTYMILAAQDCTVVLEGDLSDPASIEITLNPGWNWIGFPSANEMTIIAALANLAAEEGDMFANSDQFTEFDGEEWYGDVETLLPGQGFMYFNNTDDVKTFYYPSAKMRVLGAQKSIQRQVPSERLDISKLNKIEFPSKK